MNTNNLEIRYDLILGSKRPSNYFWMLSSLLGGLGFLVIGLSSYPNFQFPHIKTTFISFIPQGIVMTFYGFIGILLGIFLLLNIIFDVGGGYNKYDKNKERIDLFRIGFPIGTHEIYLTYKFEEVKSIKLRIEDGLNPKREIYLITKDKRQIPLTRVGEPELLSSIEEEALTLASFLNVPLED
jgi:hypothetical protein